jgi:hypothetical protein
MNPARVNRECLYAVNQGRVPVAAINDVDGHGNYEFVLSNGWHVFVFDDCGTWDYIDHLVAPTGEHIRGERFHCFNPDDAKWRWDDRPNPF